MGLGVGEGGLNGANGQVSQLPSVQPSGSPSLSPGPPRDMQPTMKFVMDTSKYWFKPSITREQGKGGQCFGGRGWGIRGEGLWQVQGRAVSCRPPDLRK